VSADKSWHRYYLLSVYQRSFQEEQQHKRTYRIQPHRAQASYEEASLSVKLKPSVRSCILASDPLVPTGNEWRSSKRYLNQDFAVNQRTLLSVQNNCALCCRRAAAQSCYLRAIRPFRAALIPIISAEIWNRFI